VAWSVLVGISVVLLRAPAWAEPLRLEQRVVPACVAAARELAPSVQRRLGSFSPNELAASVVIDVLGAGYRVSIALRDTEQARGTTTIDAPTCQEAVDAAAVVLALAFGNATHPEPTEAASSPVPERAGWPTAPLRSFTQPSAAPSDTQPSSAARSAPRDWTRIPARWRPSRSGERSVPRDSVATSGAHRATRITLTSGVDRGTLPQATLTLTGAVARSFGAVELAAIARYGLPIAEERVETGFSESQRHDFGALELRACRGLGQAVRLSACAGTELGAVRTMRATQGDDRAELDTAQISPRVAGTLAMLVAHRGWLIEPGLELAGAAVVLGRETGARRLSVRVAAGAAIAF
jgi:hypothetical protein